MELVNIVGSLLGSGEFGNEYGVEWFVFELPGDLFSLRNPVFSEMDVYVWVGVIEAQNVVIGLTVADDGEFHTERIITFPVVADWIMGGNREEFASFHLSAVSKIENTQPFGWVFSMVGREGLEPPTSSV